MTTFWASPESTFGGLIDQFMPKDQRPDEWDHRRIEGTTQGCCFGYDADQDGSNLGAHGAPRNPAMCLEPSSNGAVHAKEIQVGTDAMR
mgnify:CR=1 FL=1